MQMLLDFSIVTLELVVRQNIMNERTYLYYLQTHTNEYNKILQSSKLNKYKFVCSIF